MRPNKLKELVRSGQPAFNAWLSIPSSYSAEVLGHQGFDSVTVDLQHGMIGFDAAVPMLQAISSTPAVPMVRVSKNDYALVMQLLDAGAYGVICPMISSVKEAQDFVSYCRYPPTGQRSFGPARGLLFGGTDYAAHANQEILAFAMLETREAVAHAEAILSVDGLDGIYVGPNDLCLSYGVPPVAESKEPAIVECIGHLAAMSKQKGKISGIFCSSGEGAAQRISEGFDIVTPGNDVGLLSRAAREAITVARSRSHTGRATPGSGY
jgi:4-hydroxy-2-oxoheptanedioate aldolase